MSRRTCEPSLREAQAIVFAATKPVGSEWADLGDCLHRVVRQDIASRRAHPCSDSAARDGFCFRAAATGRASPRRPAILRIRATIRCGDRPRAAIGRGECARIMTGGILPPGADAVIPVEHALSGGEYIRVPYAVRAGTHVYRTGRIVKAGGRVASKGDYVGPGLLGLLAAVGVRKARISRRVRMGIVSTGDEVVEARRSQRDWQVYDSNSVMLMGLAQELEAEVLNLGIAKDTGADIEASLRAGESCDIVIMTGGSSMGISDHVPATLRRYGCRVLIRGMRLRPGKHVTFARKGSRVFFGLPGRPGGCFGLFHLLVRPALMAMMGCARPAPVALRGTWAGGAMERPRIDTLFAAHLGPRSEIRPVSDTSTGDLGALARSNSLVLIRTGRDSLRKGDILEVFPVRLP